MARASRGGEIALAAVSLLVALLVAEGAVRLLLPGSKGTGYAPVRTDRRDRRPINSKGYRDFERAVPKPEGVRRAVCIGDSFTWGVSVLFDDAWPQRVERTLSRERGERWEVVNLAEPKLEIDQAGAIAFAASLALAQKRDKWESKLDKALGPGSGGALLDALDGLLGGKKDKR